jgi:hypothetical protein
MHIKFLILPGTLVLWAVSSWAGNLTIDEREIDFGEKYQFAVVERDIRVWNHSSETIKFDDVKPSKIGATLAFDQRTLAPYASEIAHLKLPLLDNKGYVSTRLEFDTEEGGKTEKYSVLVRGYLDSVLDDVESGVDFGVVDIEAASAEKSFRLASAKYPGLRITRIVESAAFLDTHLGQNSGELLLRPKRVNVLGFRKGVIKVAIDTPEQPQVWVPVLMDIHGNVVPDQNPLSLGVQRPGTLRPTRLQLSSRDGKAFHVGKVSTDETARVTVEETPCLPKARDDCRAYMVMNKKDRPQGQVVGKIGFELPDSHQVLNIDLAGVFLADSTKVHPLNAPAQSEGGDRQTTVAPKTDLSAAITKAIGEQPQVEAPGSGPLLKWQVANEGGIYGYAIYRSDSENGRFSRVNDKIVSAGNLGDNITASYQWRDTGADKGKGYWYYITTFYNSGKKVQLTSPQKVVAK